MTRYVEDRLDAYADDYARHPVWNSIKLGLAGIVVIGVLAAIIGLISTGSVFFAASKAKFTAAPRVTQKVYAPDNVIANVAFFHDTCNAVSRDLQVYRNNEARYQADRNAARLQTDPLQQAAAVNALSTEQQDVTAALNAAQDAAASYNSASAQYTRNPFKDAGLPYRITVPTDPRDLATFSVACN
jgi:hypothetical protein